jgi:hypothetical protein
MYLKECEPGYNKDTCTPMFITAVFTMAKYGNRPGALQLTNGFLKKSYIYICTYIYYICTYIYIYIYSMEYFSILRENEIMLFTCRWMELKTIVLSEVSQVQKTKVHVFFLICRRQIQKLNTYINTSMIMCVCVCVCV